MMPKEDGQVAEEKRWENISQKRTEGENLWISFLLLFTRLLFFCRVIIRFASLVDSFVAKQLPAAEKEKTIWDMAVN